MMVPRAFVFSSAPHQTTPCQTDTEKLAFHHRTKQSLPLHHDVSCLQPASVTNPMVVTHTDPVVIPPKRARSKRPIGTNTGIRNGAHNVRRGSALVRRSLSTSTLSRNVPASVATMLELTTIPPRKSWTVRSSRKLPSGNHVEDFSRLLLEGIEPRDEYGNAFDSVGNAPLDLLLSPPDDENEKSTVANEMESEAPLSVRSLSTDSMPSLDNELESIPTYSLATPSLSQRRLLEKRKQLSLPEDCAMNHPLLETDDSDSRQPFFAPLDPFVVPSRRPNLSRGFPRLGATFKSNLTASLRALKSAAQTVSNFATPSVQPDDFLTRSLFSITPELTDDRRPLPMNGPPSPALRRYLNPITLSPAEMHVYHDFPQDLDQASHTCPVSIQMQTYHRSGSSGGNKQSCCSTGSAGGNDQDLYSFDPEVPPSRQREREPRENCDFLRMVVLEMNMRRSGKLRDDIPTRAKVWLPPRKPARLIPGTYGDEEETAIPQRWIGVSIGCV